ncbi:hypothetical protein ACTNEW_16375, partial [Blautia sp. HCP3S3_G3]|uniref:hypothetical protein n=1 Tax=Blautia sp. HCP3S3_G3 TaxID=3438913 RepID=UPI003F894E9C
RFFTNRAKSVILFYSEVFFSQPSFSEFLIFELYKKLLLPIPYRTFSKKFRVLNASGIRLAPTEAERRVDFSSG